MTKQLMFVRCFKICKRRAVAVSSDAMWEDSGELLPRVRRNIFLVLNRLFRWRKLCHEVIELMNMLPLNGDVHPDTCISLHLSSIFIIRLDSNQYQMIYTFFLYHFQCTFYVRTFSNHSFIFHYTFENSFHFNFHVVIHVDRFQRDVHFSSNDRTLLKPSQNS